MKNKLSIHRDKTFYPKPVMDDYGNLVYCILPKYLDRWIVFGPKGVLSRHDNPKNAQAAFEEWQEYFESSNK